MSKTPGQVPILCTASLPFHPDDIKTLIHSAQQWHFVHFSNGSLSWLKWQEFLLKNDSAREWSPNLRGARWKGGEVDGYRQQRCGKSIFHLQFHHEINDLTLAYVCDIPGLRKTRLPAREQKRETETMKDKKINHGFSHAFMWPMILYLLYLNINLKSQISICISTSYPYINIPMNHIIFVSGITTLES